MNDINPQLLSLFQNILSAAQQVLILYIIVAVGFFADRLSVFTEKTARASNDLLFYVITPCVIVNSFLNTQFTKESGTGFFIALACSFCAHFLGMLYGTPLFNKTEKENAPIYKFACVYGNLGYMALPIANSVLGAEGVFLCSGGVIALNTLAFTHGVWLMNKGEKVKFKLSSLILNPGVISVIVGLPLFLLSVKLPEVISAPIKYISDLNTPLAMIIFGTYLSKTDLKTIFKIKQQYIIAAIRLVAVPVTILIAATLLKLPPVLKVACIISASAPCANNTVMFSAKYGKDTALASKIVALNSFISVITMPIMIAIARI